MKELLLLIAFMGIASCLFSQVSKTVTLTTAGTLSTSLASNELDNITNLTITGTIESLLRVSLKVRLSVNSQFKQYFINKMLEFKLFLEFWN